MAIEDNRSITTNMEEIFLLQSIDGGGAGGGGGFNGKYLTIGAAINQQFGEPSISVGENSFATNTDGFAMGVETVTAGAYGLTYGLNNKNFQTGTIVLGTNNYHPPLSTNYEGAVTNVMFGDGNRIYCRVYDSNWNQVSLENNNSYAFGYYSENDGFFYESLEFSDATKITYVNGRFYYDLFKFTKGNTDLSGIYFYIDDTLYTLAQLKNNQNYHCKYGNYSYGNILGGYNNKINLYNTESQGNILLGDSNLIDTNNNDG